MPRIEAENIEEHIRIQTNRILDAAAQLFTERGYRGTEMRDIAGSIGLRRNSLYRYFPNKDHILLACVRREMEPNLERVRALQTREPDPRKRVDAWLDLQMDIAATACHGMMHMSGEISESEPELRQELSALHEPPNQVLRTAVDELLEGTGRDAELVSAMISSILRSAAAVALRGGDSVAAIKELKTSVGRILDTTN
ncbi:MAG: helix-turn-helix domain-containing protein [Gammaproteobacteria bacterium]|nr:helix-turn-helix domain-containing protein [Gammaproteobacteria bacterium]